MLNLPSKETIGDFWNDCVKNNISNHEKINAYCKIYKNVEESNSKKKNKDNSKYLMELYLNPNSAKKKKNNDPKDKSKNQSFENQNLAKIFKKHPLIKEKTLSTIEEIENKKKKKTSLMRCLGLYAYGMEVKKEKLLADKSIQIEKLNDEILKCTFKPKINKYSSSKTSKFLNGTNNKKTINNDNKNNINNVYRITTISSYENGITNKTEKHNNTKDIQIKQNLPKDEEYTFKPKLNKGDIKSIFDKSKSIEKDKVNEIFIDRYNKAREFYMTKKIKQLSNKDESYSTMLNEYNFFTSKHRKNKKFNFSINNNINTETNKNNNLIKIENSIVQKLRNELLDINLNEDEKL